MDLSLNINITVLVAIIGILEYIKGQDVSGKYKKIYGLFFILISLIVGVGLSFIDGLRSYVLIAQSIIYAVEYFGIGTIVYQLVVKYTKKILESKLTLLAGEKIEDK